MKYGLAILGSLILPCSLYAAPVYYTFEGKVDSYRYPEISGSLQIGDELKYVLLIDRELPGYSYFHSVKYTTQDTPEIDYFYVGDAAGFNYDYYIHQGKNIFGRESEINGTPQVSISTLLIPYGLDVDSTYRGESFGFITNTRFDDWFVGQNDFNVSISGRFYGNSMMTLTAISNVNPVVPEPSSFVLTALGFVFMAGIHSQRRKR